MAETFFLIEADCYLGAKSLTSVTLAASGLLTWTLTAAVPLPIVGQKLRVEATSNAAVWVEGIVTKASATTLAVTIDVRSMGTGGTLADWTLSTGTLYFATRSYITEPTETPPNVYYDERIVQAGEIGRYMFDRGTTGGASRVEAGTVVLANADGRLDPLLDFGLDGRALTIRIGSARLEHNERVAYPAGFTTLLVGTCSAVSVDFGTVSLSLRTRQYDLDAAMMTATFAGTNSLPSGLEGTANDIKGKVKPRVLGSASNVTPPCVNTSRLEFQVNVAAVDDVTAVYDNGVSLTKGAAYTSQSDMDTNAPAASTYRVWPAGGYFRLGSTPAGQVTADVREVAAATSRSVAGILPRVAAIVAPSLTVNAADLTALQALQPAEIEFWRDAETTGAEALDAICASVGAWWGLDRLAQIRVKRLDAPTGGPPKMTFRRASSANPLATGEADIISYELYPPADQPGGLPVRQVTASYAPNWTPQTNVAGSVASARVAWLALASRDTAPAVAAATATLHPLADVFRVETALVTEAAATAERDRVLAMRSVRRDRGLLQTHLDTVVPTIDLGDEVRVVLSRFGYGGAGRAMIVTSLRLDARARRLSLELWG